MFKSVNYQQKQINVNNNSENMNFFHVWLESTNLLLNKTSENIFYSGFLSFYFHFFIILTKYSILLLILKIKAQLMKAIFHVFTNYDDFKSENYLMIFGWSSIQIDSIMNSFTLLKCLSCLSFNLEQLSWQKEKNTAFDFNLHYWWRLI